SPGPRRRCRRPPRRPCRPRRRRPGPCRRSRPLRQGPRRARPGGTRPAAPSRRPARLHAGGQGADTLTLLGGDEGVPPDVSEVAVRHADFLAARPRQPPPGALGCTRVVGDAPTAPTVCTPVCTREANSEQTHPLAALAAALLGLAPADRTRLAALLVAGR